MVGFFGSSSPPNFLLSVYHWMYHLQSVPEWLMFCNYGNN